MPLFILSSPGSKFREIPSLTFLNHSYNATYSKLSLPPWAIFTRQPTIRPAKNHVKDHLNIPVQASDHAQHHSSPGHSRLSSPTPLHLTQPALFVPCSAHLLHVHVKAYVRQCLLRPSTHALCLQRLECAEVDEWRPSRCIGLRRL
jgi:hypothetical protein